MRTIDPNVRADALGGVPGALGNLLNAQFKLGSDIFKALTGSTLPQVGDVVQTLQARTKQKGCCDIPPPCWMPRSLGECTSHVGQCKSACIDLVVTNCDMHGRTIKVEVPKAGSEVTVTPGGLELGPFERGTISVCYNVPQNAATAQHDYLVWVHGCRSYYLRWTVSVGTVGLASCHEIDIDDCPDYRHHWYDHFYCGRRCPDAANRLVGANG